MKASRPMGALLLSSQGLAPAGIGRTPSGPVFGGGVVGGELVSVDEGPVLVGVVGDDELEADENWGTMWHAVRMGTSAINGAYRARPRIGTLSEEGEMSPEKVNFIHTVAPVVGRGSSPGIMVPTPLPDRSHRLYRAPANASCCYLPYAAILAGQRRSSGHAWSGRGGACLASGARGRRGSASSAPGPAGAGRRLHAAGQRAERGPPAGSSAGCAPPRKRRSAPRGRAGRRAGPSPGGAPSLA